MTCTHARVTEWRRELDSYSFNPSGLFHLKGHLHDPFKGVLHNTHIHAYIKPIVQGNLKPFAEPVRVVYGRGTADLRLLSQAITETFNRIMRNLSELRKQLVISTVSSVYLMAVCRHCLPNFVPGTRLF